MTKHSSGSEVRIAFLTDIHVGHPQVSGDTIRYNLMRWCYPHLDSTIDLLIIGGDFFHTLLDMNSRAGYFARVIIDDLRELAHKHQFYIRINTGTFKHDRKQLQFFLSEEEELLHDQPLVKVFTELTIEHIPSLDLDILYKPDDLPYDDADQRIYTALQNNHLQQVDFLVNHGYFEHLLPFGIPQPKNTLSIKSIKKVVRGCVLNGHIHTPSIYQNVISGGSFERMVHGEEGEKGFFLVDYDRKVCKYTFIENKTACPFKTYRYTEHTTLDQFITWIREEGIEECETYHLRLFGDDPGAKAELESYVKTNYPNVILKTESSITKKKENINTTTFVVDSLPPVTEANLPEMIYEHIKHKLDIDTIKQILKESGRA